MNDRKFSESFFTITSKNAPEVLIVGRVIAVQILEVLSQLFGPGKVQHIDEGAGRGNGRVVAEAVHHWHHVIAIGDIGV